MGKRSYFYTFIMIAWIFLGIFLSEKIFGNDSLAEIVLVICLASVALLISFGIEYLIRGQGIQFSNVIVTRELTIDGDKEKRVRIEILQPQLSPEGMYLCEFRIEGAPEGMTNVKVGGADSYQALCLTLRTVATAVDLFNKKHCKSKLRWLGEKDLDLHFTTAFEDK